MARTSSADIGRVLAGLADDADPQQSLNELAALAGLSRFYFSRTFRRVVGMPLRDYLRKQKLRRALILMRRSGRSLTDIAVEAGFYDLPHLDKVFRQHLGMSPRRFRARQTGRKQLTARRLASASRRGF
jgi:transcriptional regulator GlxA family with amidase domain